MGRPRIDMVGQRFGRLTVLKYLTAIRREAVYLCQCDCGTLTTAGRQQLRSGIKKSCSCLAREKSIERFTTHGKSHSVEYQAWSAMWNAVRNTKRPQYKYCGALGISVCERWKEFSNFLADMGNRPEGTCLIRIDRLKDFSPDNCVWGKRDTKAYRAVLTNMS